MSDRILGCSGAGAYHDESVAFMTGVSTNVVRGTLRSVVEQTQRLAAALRGIDDALATRVPLIASPDDAALHIAAVIEPVGTHVAWLAAFATRHGSGHAAALHDTASAVQQLHAGLIDGAGARDAVRRRAHDAVRQLAPLRATVTSAHDDLYTRGVIGSYRDVQRLTSVHSATHQDLLTSPYFSPAERRSYSDELDVALQTSRRGQGVAAVRAGVDVQRGRLLERVLNQPVT
jgi:hypothetical protein